MDAPFFAVIKEIDKKLKEMGCNRSGAFFRGHSKGSYRLLPSLLRNNLPQNTEHNLYQEFFLRANYLLPREATSWERLAFLQHYGVPTRLLDWTESLGVALFFALLDSPEKAHLWIVNAFRLNQVNDVSPEPRILTAGLDALPDYHDCFASIDNRKTWPYKKPIFLQIPWTTARLRAQSGFFTFHPTSDTLDTLSPQYTRRVEIPNEAFPGVKRFLQLAGITEYTVFPDFVGLAAFLRHRFRL
jgi:hypothetical protein